MAERKIKSVDEQIAELEAQLEKKENRLKELKKRKTQEDRKKRTKRLIEIGGAVESVLKKSLGDEEGIVQDSDIQAVIDFLQGQEERGNYFSKAVIERRKKAAKDISEDIDDAEASANDISDESDNNIVF